MCAVSLSLFRLVSILRELSAMNTSKRVLFVDLEMHKRTGSAQFFVELLRRGFLVDVCYVNSRYDPRMPTPESVKPYDAIVYWQVTPSNYRAKSFNKPSIYIPMYDAETFNTPRWRRNRLQGGRAICFCDKEADFLKKLGFDFLKIKYYVQCHQCASGNPRKAFLWDRNLRSLNLVKNLFRPSDIDELVIRCDPSKVNRISSDDITRLHIRFVSSDKHLTQEEYFAMFADCGIYIAPRLREGIGMSFLEAMSFGKCVIAHNDATMNEYIRDGITGFLVDYNANKSHGLDLSKVSLIQEQTYLSSQKGREHWEEVDAPNVIAYIEKAIEDYTPMSFADKLLWWLMLPFHFCFDVCTWVRTRGRKLVRS